MLEIDNLTFNYPKRRENVLNDFSLQLAPGGIYGLLGRNGAGKSTLLYLICGLLFPQKGRVLYKGADTRRRLPDTLSDIFIVPEEFTLPAVSLNQYIKINGPFYPKFSVDDMHRHLSTFDIAPDINLGALSMGQKKKVYMSFARACNTSLLLMDEPTNGLDIPGKSAFRRFIVSSMREDQTIIISTHQVRDIDSVLDHVIIMDNHNVLFNHSAFDITRALKFASTQDRDIIQRALYTQNNPSGVTVVLPNNDDEDSQLDLEALFNFALESPGLLNRQFTNLLDN